MAQHRKSCCMLCDSLGDRRYVQKDHFCNSRSSPFYNNRINKKTSCSYKIFHDPKLPFSLKVEVFYLGLIGIFLGR